MGGSRIDRRSLRDLVVLHGKHTLLGLVVIVVPVVVVGKSIQLAYGALHKALHKRFKPILCKPD